VLANVQTEHASSWGGGGGGYFAILHFFLSQLQHGPGGRGLVMISVVDCDMAHGKPEPCLQEAACLMEQSSAVDGLMMHHLHNWVPDAGLCPAVFT